MKSLTDWAQTWGISQAALADLFAVEPIAAAPGINEASVQAAARVNATTLGGRLWRNNVGAGTLDSGSYIRWGLCNDSPAINRNLKSADLIGIYPRLISPADVGSFVGQFWSVECKRSDWRPHANNSRDQAQARWSLMIQSLGGRAQITTGGTL